MTELYKHCGKLLVVECGCNDNFNRWVHIKRAWKSTNLNTFRLDYPPIEDCPKCGGVKWVILPKGCPEI